MSTPRTENDGGFPLPDVIDPPRICIQINLPDDDAHLRAFWGCLYDLTRWFNWQADDDHTAKQVADVWLDVWLQAHDHYRDRTCMTDPCCPDTNDLLATNNTLLNRIITLIEGGFKIVPLVADQPNDVIPDCAPPVFDSGGSSDDPFEALRRKNALCLTVERYVARLMFEASVDFNMSLGVIDTFRVMPSIIAPSNFMYFAKFKFNTELTVPIVESWIDGVAWKEVVCALINQLAGQEVTWSAFANAAGNIDTSSYDENTKALVYTVKINNAEKTVFEAFTKELNAAFDELDDVPGYTCSCVPEVTCDPATLDIIGLDGTIVTRIDDTHWHIEQTAYTVDPDLKRRYIATIREASFQCFNYAASTQGQAGYDNYGCGAGHYTGAGGGTGTGMQFGFIHLEDGDLPETGVDSIFTILCP